MPLQTKMSAPKEGSTRTQRQQTNLDGSGRLWKSDAWADPKEVELLEKQSRVDIPGRGNWVCKGPAMEPANAAIVDSHNP